MRTRSGAGLGYTVELPPLSADRSLRCSADKKGDSGLEARNLSNPDQRTWAAKYGKQLRERLVQATVAAQKKAQALTKIAADLGIRDQLLGGWVPKSHSQPVVRSVEMLEDAAKARTNAELQLRLPGGAVVEGLTLAHLATLLRPGR